MIAIKRIGPGAFLEWPQIETEEDPMSDTFTKGMARNIYLGGGVFFFLVFLALTYHTETTFPKRTNQA